MSQNTVNIVAEIGVNHNGCLDTAKRLAHMAKICKVDFVKFQTWREDRWNDLKHLHLTYDEQLSLFQYCDDIGIKWFSTAFDLESIDFLYQQNQKIWKIPSGMIMNRKYLAAISETNGEWFILSTGASTLDEVVESSYYFPPSKLTVLQCVTKYPADYHEMSLNCMQKIARRTHTNLYGLSDHTMGDEVAIAAVALGACMIEKHITLDRTMKGPDHLASIEPRDLCNMVQKIRNVEMALGDNKTVTSRERLVRDTIRKRMEL